MLAGFRFHDLRHVFVAELFRGGASALAVQALAGHADLTTTQRYAHMVKSDLQAAIATLERGKGVETNPGTGGARGCATAGWASESVRLARDAPSSRRRFS
jgi:hypothetical protein